VVTVQDFLDSLQHITPEHLAEDWDNIGLLVGDPQQPVQRILLALDPACSLIDQALNGCYDLILTHHPIIFRPLKALRTDTPTGRFIAAATRHHISVIACHTNLDVINGGVSDFLAQALGLEHCQPLVPSRRGSDATCGLGRLGDYAAPIMAEDFLNRVRQICAPPWILEAGPRPDRVERVAVCGGSGSDLAESAQRLGADVLLTAEVKHSVARWAEDAGLWLLDAGHFTTEHPAMVLFRDRLRQAARDHGWDLIIDTAHQVPPLRLA
jgi:dinuclear metal center YbgI/SA1388 family protein